MSANPSRNPFHNIGPYLKHAAQDGQLISMRCNGCRRQVNYYATELVDILGPNWPIKHPPWPCSACRSKEWIEVRGIFPSQTDQGKFYVRRLVKIKRVPVWRNELFGEVKR